MRFALTILSLALFASSAVVRAQPADDAQSARLIEPAPIEATPGLSARDAIVLGLVEGITEFLPISSTGHLIIANRALGLDAEKPMRDERGAVIWYKAPSADHPQGVPLTLKIAADTYIVVIQVGAILAVIFLFWGQLMGICGGLLGKNASGLRLLRNLLLAFFPVVIVGLAANDWIDENLFSIGTVVVALVSGAVLMFCAERWRKRERAVGVIRKEPSELTIGQSLGIGLMQCLALWPGMSRSMVTMVGGYFAGLAPAKAAEFSFLVGLPVLGGAAVYKVWQAGSAMTAVFGWSEMLLGGAVATISAIVAVKVLVSYLGRHGLEVFAVYRLILAAILTGLFLL